MTLWCFLLASIACSTDAIPTAPSGPEQNRLVAKVSIAPGDLVIAPDETFQLSAVVKSARGRVVNGRTVTWSSSDESVIRIDGLGNIVAGREGTATIRANVEGVTGTATVDVRGEVVEIEIDVPDRAFSEGGTQQLSATYIYRNGARRTAGKLFWWSSDPDRLVVDGDGLVRGLRPGNVRVNGQGKGKSSTLELIVEDTEEETVTVSADEIEMAVGDSVQLWADVLNPDGDRLSRKVKWSSSDPAVASVDDEGLVIALSVGSATVTAKSGNVSDSTLVTVVDATTSSDSDGSTSDGTSDDGSTSDDRSSSDDGSTTTSTQTTSLPGTVSDLAVKTSYTTYNSVTLTFTEVDDGTGQPADYDVRYIESPMDTRWGEAASVTKGTCATPLQGTSIGATMTCSVEGLQASTSYDFQLVAFRGTMNQDAVYGELSNIATEVTGDAPIVVDVVPSSFEIEVEQTKQLEASVTDVYGNPVDATVTWSTSSSYVATVDNTGLVSGEEAGDASITASAEGDSDSSDATVTETTTSSSDDGTTSEGSSTSGSHEPSGYERIFEHNWSTVPEHDVITAASEAGELLRRDKRSNSTVTSDAGAPRSPSDVYRTKYPAGLEDGFAPANIQIWDKQNECQATEYSEIYFRVWIKIGDVDYENQSNGTKLGFWAHGEPCTDANNQSYFFGGNPENGDQSIVNSVRLQFHQQSGINRNHYSSQHQPTGEWHLWEVVQKLNSAPGVADGVFKWWYDGNLILDRNDVEYIWSGNEHGFHLFKWNPTWGGNSGQVRTRDDFIYIDHMYISGKR